MTREKKGGQHRIKFRFHHFFGPGPCTRAYKRQMTCTLTCTDALDAARLAGGMAKAGLLARYWLQTGTGRTSLLALLKHEKKCRDAGQKCSSCSYSFCTLYKKVSLRKRFKLGPTWYAPNNDNAVARRSGKRIRNNRPASIVSKSDKRTVDVRGQKVNARCTNDRVNPRALTHRCLGGRETFILSTGQASVWRTDVCGGVGWGAR